MKKRLFTYSALCGTGLLFACASPSPMSSLAVKPVLNISGTSERPDGYYQLGRYYQGQNRLDQAIDAYRKALALDRNFIDAHNALGAAYAAQGRLDEAVVEFKIVVTALPVTSYAWNNLGYTYLLQGRSAEAVAALERATAFDLTNQRALNNLGTALAQRGDSAAANEKFARAAELATIAAATSAAPVPAALLAAAPIASPAAAPVASAAVVADVSVVAAPASPAVVPDVSVAAAPIASAVAVSEVSVAAAPAPVAVVPDVSAAAVAAVSSAIQSGAATPPSIGDRAAFERRKEASEPIELGLQRAASGESAKERAPLVAAVVDSTGAHELVQIAPNVLELRRAASQSVMAAPPPIAAQSFRLEVSNGNGVTGMAKRIGQQLAATGLPMPRLTNQKPFRQPTTEIQYRDGYAEVAASLRSRMPSQPPMIKTVALRASTDVRVVLGKDLPRDVAMRDPADEPTQLANATQSAIGSVE